MDSGKTEKRLADQLWLVGLIVLVGGVYFGAAGLWGLWEPWETDLARIGRSLSTTDGATWLFPVDGDGSSINKPWMTALLLGWGYVMSQGSPLMWLLIGIMAVVSVFPLYGLGRALRLNQVVSGAAAVGISVGIGALVFVAATDSEFWLRAPFALLALLTVLASFGFIRQFVGVHRAGLTACILAASPLFLMSAVNLAGAMPQMATTTLALGCFAMAVCRKGHILWMGAAGLLTGLSLWAGGIEGPVLVLGSLACFGLWSAVKYPRFRFSFGTCLILFLMAGGVSIFPVYHLLTHGFAESKDVLGLFVPLGLAVVLLTASWFGEAFSRLGWGGFFLPLLGIAATALPPVLLMLDQWSSRDVLSFLLYNDFLTNRSLPDHVSFDNLVRQIGFAAYPFTALLPLGLAYLVQTVNPEKGDAPAAGSIDNGCVERKALKMFFLCWLVVGIVQVGLTSTLTRHYLFVAMLPMAAAVGLMLTDAGYWNGLRKNRTLLYFLGFISLILLMVLTKDLKTKANPELGQLGPEVLFEFLLVDGREGFPETFHLPLIVGLRWLWVVAIAMFFWVMPGATVRAARGLGTALKSLSERATEYAHQDEIKKRREMLEGQVGAGAFFRKANNEAKNMGHALKWAAMASENGLGTGLLFCLRGFNAVLGPVRRVIGQPFRFAAVLLATFIAFGAFTAFAYLPSLSNHLSTRGLIDTYRELAQSGETIYRVGSSTRQVTYYLAEDEIALPTGDINQIDTIRNVSGLRDYFCDVEQRMFAIIGRDALAQAYYEVRHTESSEPDCFEGRDLWVLDARSSRYLLLSNVLRDGEENQNPIAEHVFEQAPDDLEVPEHLYTFDGDIRLLGFRILDEDDEWVESASSGQTVYFETFYEVISRPSSSREMFIHVDYGNNRINGDHDVVDGEYPINYWVPGEIVRDRYPLTIDRGSAAGEYTIFMGFFTGDTRMQVSPAGGDNRIAVGTITISGGI